MAIEAKRETVMGKYVYIYFGGSGEDSGSAEDWGKWFGQLGKKIIDPGNQFGHDGKAVHAGGVMEVKEMPATGYTIVTADTMEQATEMAKGCPLTGSTNGAVCVYEAMPM